MWQGDSITFVLSAMKENPTCDLNSHVSCPVSPQPYFQHAKGIWGKFQLLQQNAVA